MNDIHTGFLKAAGVPLPISKAIHKAKNLVTKPFRDLDAAGLRAARASKAPKPTGSYHMPSFNQPM